MRFYAGLFVIWFSFGVVTSVIYRLFFIAADLGYSWPKTIAIAFGCVSLLAALLAAAFWGTYLMGAPI
jgi:hypothetical protein